MKVRLPGTALQRTAALLMTFFAVCIPSQAATESDNKAISPDGRSLAYESGSKGSIEFRLLDVASGKSKPLVRLPGDNRWPVWSPDGNFIAFCSTFKGHHFITVADITGHSWLVTEVLGNPSHVTWSPDSVWLVFASEVTPGNRDLFAATAGGTDLRNLTKSPQISESNPLWLADSKRITFRYREPASNAEQAGELEWDGLLATR